MSLATPVFADTTATISTATIVPSGSYISAYPKKNITIIRTAIASRIRIIGSPNVSLNSCQKVVGSESGISFEPYFAREASTS